jgi:hypothetical protein
MKGGVIGNNSCTYNDGGGVYLDEKGYFTMNGGEVTGNKCRETGGGVCISKSSSVFTMNGGEISLNQTTYNKSTSSGGGVAREAGKFNKYGGTIYGTNHCDKTKRSARGFSHSYADSEAPARTGSKFKDYTI